MSQNKKAIIYARYNTSPTADKKLSLVNQVSECLTYARIYNLDVVEIVTDCNQSSNHTFPKLVEKISNYIEKIDVLICYKMDRLSRNLNSYFTGIRQLESINVEVKAVDLECVVTPRGIEPNASDSLVKNMLMAIANFDYEMKSQRVKDSMMAKFEQGYWLWQPPLGYKKQFGSNLLEIDEENASVVRRLFSSVKKLKNGNALFYVDMDSIENEYQLSKNKIYSIIRNPFYKGYMYSKSWNLIVKGKHDPLVSEKDWERAQSITE